MEQLLETIDLDVEEASELLFKIKVEGIDPAPATVRLVCEADDVSYMFNGYPVGDDVVQFKLPVMKGKLKEGSYLSRVEVMVENRYFAPITFNINLKQTIRVVAESIKAMPRAQVNVPRVSVTAVPVVRKPAVTEANGTLRERYAARFGRNKS